MTIKDLKEKKITLESGLKDLINKFEQETSEKVSDIRFYETAKTLDGQNHIFTLEVEVKI